MSNSSKLYSIITACFVIAFLLPMLWKATMASTLSYVLLALGVLLFAGRIARGDD